ncbi:hypothetical protein [Nocardioides sp.]|uniref:hypothetical protein n=1 Tax=Nocardioides sp. TaxID=35761 RepID=UPI002735154B|nr:hypothetical protein [Nocardioides sp.]MDP3893422.1 hypothetical protein [Nocardioides sp.]
MKISTVKATIAAAALAASMGLAGCADDDDPVDDPTIINEDDGDEGDAPAEEESPTDDGMDDGMDDEETEE